MDLHDEIRALARPLREPDDLDPLLDRIGHARVVLLGEASHGTSEFYRWRTAITQRLVEELGFGFVAVEGDWPDCQRVDRYVQDGIGRSAREVLAGYERWPTWMWGNEEVVELVEWMRSSPARPGFHGLDVYSLRDSLAEVLAWVRQHDPDAVPAALDAAECLQRGDARRYRLVRESCEDEVVELLSAIRHGGGDGDRFGAEQNAWVVRSADQYYRAVIRGGPHSWNVRDRHMADTLERLLSHHGPGARGIVWAHNTHIGDARFTDMAQVGMLNLGQLARERWGEAQVALVGFATWAGTVLAGRDWEAPVATMPVPPARPDSWEALLHEALGGDGLLLLDDLAGRRLADEERDQRAIGVVYRPENERGNYVPTVLSGRYDALLYLDQTRALHPLAPAAVPREEEPPETFPTGF
jgi:erythromycin esterase